MATFQDYLEQRSKARDEQARALARNQAAKFSAEDFLKMHAAAEWAGVEDRVWALVEHAEVSGRRFSRQDHAVGLGAATVRFVSRATDPSASPCLFGLAFGLDGSPPVKLQGYKSASVPPQGEHWKMRAVVSEGDILWTRADVPTRRAETPAELANQVAVKLVELFDKLERVSGRDALFPGGAAVPVRG